MMRSVRAAYEAARKIVVRACGHVVRCSAVWSGSWPSGGGMEWSDVKLRSEVVWCGRVVVRCGAVRRGAVI